MSTYTRQIGLIAICFGWYLASATSPKPSATRILSDASVATRWADLTIQVVTKAPQNTPTYCSRALGYLGLTMYETVVYSSATHQSVIRSVVDTLALPKPNLSKDYCWELALNAGQAFMLKSMYAYTRRAPLIDSLAGVIHEQYAASLPPDVVARSEQFGQAVAARIYAWSVSDGGHQGCDRNFPTTYNRPTGTGLWVPPIIGQSNTKIPMHPDWGNNRTFSRRNSLLPLPKPLTYSTDSSSAYYRQYKEVYTCHNTLTESERSMVMWWGDDPTQTCTPPGHSYNLATIAIRNGKADLVKATETYARVGMAVADAFVCCWKTKFHYMVERPSSFIQANLHLNQLTGKWLPFFLEPPFPSFYSGHAVQSAATAAVLTALYGKSFSFTDDTHANRPPTDYYVLRSLTENPYYPTYNQRFVTYEARHYTSFWEAAKECAYSRLLGGIHTRHDNEVGLAEGTKIGHNINAFRWKR
ncbi:phosphatase PAP2 family protein [Fibrella sp. HMF5335]|uniref:Phosphatase PAP2 family protein n=1 Tax=Fibrella rubiginis TaxID=2817060 RepID=A0A939GKA8_9BACT|nr:phosphatase PAP2 family protein [Fibrella rubiginis]MBO0938990.1 phosphatase PAP2 family protein [Fibrella rubiginis]